VSHDGRTLEEREVGRLQPRYRRREKKHMSSRHQEGGRGEEVEKVVTGKSREKVLERAESEAWHPARPSHQSGATFSRLGKKAVKARVRGPTKGKREATDQKDRERGGPGVEMGRRPKSSLGLTRSALPNKPKRRVAKEEKWGEGFKTRDACRYRSGGEK